MGNIEDFYNRNTLIHKDRQLSKSASDWVKSFSCESLCPLIVCRGPVRKEAMLVFKEMRILNYGILLSEKDSIIYPNALSPELRLISDHTRVHRVPDYSGNNKIERNERIKQIINIAKDNGYDSIFAGYGFMSEDSKFISAIEEAGLIFIGPCSATQHCAGEKDAAKRTALKVGVSVTPGVDNVDCLTLVNKYKSTKSLLSLIDSNKLKVDKSILQDKDLTKELLAHHILQASYNKGIDLFSIEELCEQIKEECIKLFTKSPGNRLRLKAIGSGGGKGQRILGESLLNKSNPSKNDIEKAAEAAPSLVREILNEIRATGVGDNKNILIELNIEHTRHNEIQLIGNGDWCVALGGRDCSLQMHEQKLLENSITVEGFQKEIQNAEKSGRINEAKSIKDDLTLLTRMEKESERFGQAVGLDSVSTFECIVDKKSHFFMEVNTRIQVEHRVTELVYRLKFTNPEDTEDFFIVDSLVEAMVLLAMHKKRMPKPQRLRRFGAASEVRLNATDDSLSPNAGGVITFWSDPIEDEIREDQGISIKNPDTGSFINYRLSGAYDSNIALLLTQGNNRRETYQKLSKILSATTISGNDLATNLNFQYGLVNWFLGWNVMSRPSTNFIKSYLTLVGKLKKESEKVDLDYAFNAIKKNISKSYEGNSETQDTALKVVESKRNLILRPMKVLLKEPHLFSGWLSINRNNFKIENNKLIFLCPSLSIIRELYKYLNMNWKPDVPASEVIWSHDYEILQNSLDFYSELLRHFKLKKDDFSNLEDYLSKEDPQGGYDAETWKAI
ncbi:MAG: biotin carboxylase N-terminal domain-containing protein, partial [Spirochaetales bacterium]|nr:biotin carboxylase N-terminal domain-containing protein [Spirochaetales bacterium]